MAEPTEPQLKASAPPPISSVSESPAEQSIRLHGAPELLRPPPEALFVPQITTKQPPLSRQSPLITEFPTLDHLLNCLLSRLLRQANEMRQMRHSFINFFRISGAASFILLPTDGDGKAQRSAAFNDSDLHSSKVETKCISRFIRRRQKVFGTKTCPFKSKTCAFLLKTLDGWNL